MKLFPLIKNPSYSPSPKRGEGVGVPGSSHQCAAPELRTPLTSIRGSLGLLTGGLLRSHPERAQRMLDIAAANTNRLVRLVNDILDIERLNSGHLKMEKQTCNLALPDSAGGTSHAAGSRNCRHHPLPHPGRRPTLRRPRPHPPDLDKFAQQCSKIIPPRHNRLADWRSPKAA
ncbi:histidine kinase dimerization/phospho-acceptor domain-containing protein [Kamptonema formosum]|uniref:histidine kinase dimerization/phospho-acceptor domain-containing protein n=1 Tax=Kamptonema formosum TaxID=331992 RepID=UPI000476ACF8|nr:histidine kinase dimerization/phospho-acceptor domain-containing protein [Oscillatoria sp. PCC 10802]